jgi:hypothetical protein
MAVANAHTHTHTHTHTRSIPLSAFTYVPTHSHTCALTNNTPPNLQEENIIHQDPQKNKIVFNFF